MQQLKYFLERLSWIIHPKIQMLPLPETIAVERDVHIPLSDGSYLSANIYRPKNQSAGLPVLICAHPYRKDNLPKQGLFGGYHPILSARLLRQPDPYQISSETGWEAPDPAFWVPNGYIVMNIDLRGFGKSPGQGHFFSDQEAQDYFEAITWAGSQAWSNGKVGLLGVSYLAISQYKVAALAPPHLAAICPWEGFSDFYRDLAYPGGVREEGFVPFWNHMLQRTSSKGVDSIRAAQLAHPTNDHWYDSVRPEIEKITLPVLVCGSFSDHCLHSRGSFRLFDKIASKHKWLYTHRGGKWSTFYSQEALSMQKNFFDHFLHGKENGFLKTPPVRLEIRESGHRIWKVSHEKTWPLESVKKIPLYLDAKTQTLSQESHAASSKVSFCTRTGVLSFTWQIPKDLIIVGAMQLKCYLSLKDVDDMNVFVRVDKYQQNKLVYFEGSYGFGLDGVSQGWLKASFRDGEGEFKETKPLMAGEKALLTIELLPSATFFQKGDQLKLSIQGHWFSRQNPLMCQLGDYQKSKQGIATLFAGADTPSLLLLPIQYP